MVLAEIDDLKRSFLNTNGYETNNIVELYNYYKNVEKAPGCSGPHPCRAWSISLKTTPKFETSPSGQPSPMRYLINPPRKKSGTKILMPVSAK